MGKLQDALNLRVNGKGNGNIFFELQVLARVTTPEQYYAVGRTLKLTRKLIIQYIEGKGKNRQLAVNFFNLLNEKRLLDELKEVARHKERIEGYKKELQELEKAVQLRSELAMVFKRTLDLVLIKIPEGTNPLDFKRCYFLESAGLITDPETHKDMVEHIERTVNEAIQKNNQSMQYEQSGKKRQNNKAKPLPEDRHHTNLATLLQGLSRLATPKQVILIAVEFDFNYQEVRKNLKGQVSDEAFARRLLELLSARVFEDFRSKIDRQLHLVRRIGSMLDKMERYLKLMKEK